MFEQRSLSTLLERQIGGGTPPRSNPAFWNGPIPWASVKDFEDASLTLSSTAERISQSGLDASTANLIPAGTPLVCTRMAVGRCAITTQPVAINQDVRALTPKAEVQPRYLLRLLDFLRPVAESQAVGSTVKGIRTSDYLAIKVPVAPAIEQPVIARILDTLDTKIEKTQALIAKLEQVKEGLLHDLLTRGVDENGELRPSAEEAPELYKASALGLIPTAWTVAALGDCAEVVSGITLSSKAQTSNGILVPYLRVANVQDGHIDLSDLKYIRVSVAELQSLRLQPGDVLMNEGGDFDKLGRGAVWAGQVQDCIHQNHVFRVRTDPSRLNPDFLAAFAASQIGKRFFIRASKQSTNLASINSTQLKGMPVAAAPMVEQLFIVERIRSMNGVSQRHQDALKALSLYKSGLMDDLLTGRVRVTPLLDPQETPPPSDPIPNRTPA